MTYRIWRYYFNWGCNSYFFLSGSERIAQAERKMNKTQLDMPRISNENLNISLYTDI